MEICVQIIDINPSISQLKTNKNDIISLILFDDETSEVIINLDKFIQKKDTLNFIIKNIDNNNSIKIKCTLVLNIKDILGVSEFLPKSNGIDLIQVNFVTNITEGNKITKQIYNTIQLIIKTDIKFRVGKSLIKTNSQKYFKKSFSLNQKINNINNFNNKKNENINNINEEENEDDNNNIDNNNDLYIERSKEKKASVKYSSKFMENLLKKKKIQYKKNENEKIEKNIFSNNDGNLEDNNNSGENKVFQRRKRRSITHSGKDNQSFRSKLYFSQENSKKNLQRFYVTNDANKPILLNINNSKNDVIANNNSINNSGSNNNLKTYSSDDDFKQLKLNQNSPVKINHKKSKFYVESDENIKLNKNYNNITFEENDETEKFEKIKNDLCVSHSQNYLNLIVDNNLKTEFKLVYKKLNDLQHIFHNDFLRINKNVKINKQKFFIYFHRFHHVQKKFEKFNKIKENYEQKKYLENVKLKSIKLYNENFHIIKDVEIGFINNLFDILENKKASNKIDNMKKKLIKLFVEIIRKNKNSISIIDKKYYNKIKKKYFNK